MKFNIFSKFIFYIFLTVFVYFPNKLYAQNVDKFYEKIDLFSEVLEKIQSEYVDEVDQVEVMDAAINGLLQSLDPYSGYMDPKTFDESILAVKYAV